MTDDAGWHVIDGGWCERMRPRMVDAMRTRPRMVDAEEHTRVGGEFRASRAQ